MPEPSIDPIAYGAYESLAEDFAAHVDTKPHNASLKDVEGFSSRFSVERKPRVNKSVFKPPWWIIFQK